MCLKRFIRFSGRAIGRLAEITLRGFFKGLFYVGIGLFLLGGIILALLGNILVLILGFLLTLCLYALKAFAWFTEQLFLTTKWSGRKVGDYTESFFDGISDVIKQENESVEHEIRMVIHAERLDEYH